MSVVDLTEERPEPRRLPVRRLLAWLAVWMVAALLEAFILRAQSAVPLRYALETKSIDYALLALLSLGVWRLTRAIARRRWSVLATGAAHVALGITTVLVWKGIYAGTLFLRLGPLFWELVFAGTWMYQLLSALLTYGTMLGIMLALQAGQRERERERREAELEIAAREAQLAAVRAQIHPHFLLNALNSILALSTEDPPRVPAMILALSELLQAAFSRIDTTEVPLEKEMGLVRRYLEIEQIRFGDRLHVTIDFDSDTATMPVPPLLLQPIVENAIKHGVSPHARPGVVRVSAKRDNGRLVLEVRDSGDGCDLLDSEDGDGLGLSITRRRLESAYRDDYLISSERRPDGFMVRLDLPHA